jgi:uncharacterized damage-inducible protein DinB
VSPATLLDLFAWDTWANQETLGSLRPAVTAAPKAGRLAAHIVATELLWLARIHARQSPVPVWPEVGLDETARLFADAADQWKAYLERMTVDEESRQVPYVNSKGESFHNSTVHIATHVVFHSHYHRGQIAALVRAAGYEPAYTDFIHAVRSNAFTPKEVAP